MLASEGFNEARIMAKKTVTLYSLMVQQLSKQDHYDYGLRNLKAVLNMAGQLKRNDPSMPEEAILMRVGLINAFLVSARPYMNDVVLIRPSGI